MQPDLRLAVVGHIEWIRFARVAEVPAPGGIAHASETWEGAGGGGAVAAVQLANLAGGCLFLSALGDDRVAEDVRSDLRSRNVELHAATRAAPTRTALTMVDDRGERTIVTLGDRLHPIADDPLPWDRLDGADGVRRARGARVLVATSSVMDLLAGADEALDAVVGSARDPAERFDQGRLTHSPALIVRTEGARGGSWETADGRRGRYEPAVPPLRNSATLLVPAA